MATIETQTSGNVLVIKLNRPAQYNAWTSEMRDTLADIIADGDRRAEIGALVLTGAGDKAFCAGQDLKETEKFLGRDIAQDWVRRLKRLYDAVRACSKPFVGALNGLAAGSGFQVALLLDVIVAHPGVKMGQPEVNSGIPSVFGPWIINEALGRSRAVELSVTGRMMEAAECHRIGLIHHLVEPDKVLASALTIAKDLAGKPANAMRITKKYLRRANEAGYERAWSWAAEGQSEAFETGEPQTQMRKFFDQRARKKAERV